MRSVDVSVLGRGAPRVLHRGVQARDPPRKFHELALAICKDAVYACVHDGLRRVHASSDLGSAVVGRTQSRAIFKSLADPPRRQTPRLRVRARQTPWPAVTSRERAWPSGVVRAEREQPEPGAHRDQAALGGDGSADRQALGDEAVDRRLEIA